MNIQWLISFGIDWFDLFAVQGTPAPQFESINSSVLNLLYGPVLTSAYMTTVKNHSFDCMDLCWQSDVTAF